MKRINTISLISVLILGGLLLSGTAVLAQTTTSQVSYSQKGTLNDPNSAATNPICRLNFLVGGCTKTTTKGSGQSQASSQQSGGLFASLFAAIFGGSGSKNTATAVVTLVRVPGKTEVYTIVGGKKHLVPSNEIFMSYGFAVDQIQDISAKNLAMYPRAKMFVVSGDKTGTIYYLTDIGTIRPVLNDKVMASYGDTKNDIITINQKEFNYYPRNEFVFVETPTLGHDVFQLADGEKRYVTPMALRRLKLSQTDIAPINISELDQYPPAQPIIF